ncbi:T9SS type A sorting domain-containing protein [bacterium]|nr:T9SS type A sorting domain-containing protein [bacterium]
MLIPRKIFFLAQAMARAILMAILALISALPLAAATYTVTNTNDSGAGSLRQAILDANANPGADIIDATGVSGTITVNPANYFLVITDDVTINGPGQANLTISGGGASRIFWIQNGTITIQDLTLADGYAKGGNGGGGGMGAGGAIFMHEGKQGTNHTDVASGSINLTLINVTLKDNDAIGGNGGLGNSGGGGMGGNGGSSGGVGGGGVLGDGAGYGGSVTDAVGYTAPGDNGGIAIFGKGGTESGLTNSFGGFGGGGEDGHGGFAGGGAGSVHGGGSFGYGGFGGGGGGAGTDNGFLNNGGAAGGYGGGGGGLQFRCTVCSDDGFPAGQRDGEAGFGAGRGTDIGGGGMGAGGAIFVASGTLTMKSVTFQNNTATGGNGGNDGQGLGGALFIFDKADNGDNAAPGTTNDPQVSGCDLTFSGNTASTSNDDTYGSIGFASGCPLLLTAEGPAGPIANGAPVAVTIKVDKFTNIGTLQFSINWDPSELQLDSNTPLTIDDDAPVIGTPAAGQLTYTWFDADFPDYGVTLPDGTTILTLNFTVLASAPATGIKVDITDTPTTLEASDLNFEIVPVTLMNLVDFDVSAPVVVKPFVFVANKITLERTKQHTPDGDMHSNGTLTVSKGDPSTYNSNLTAVSKITINKENTINGNVKAPSVSNSGTINGTKTIGPVANEPLPSLSYGPISGPNKTVAKGKSLTLAPNSYGIVTVNSDGKLKLSSGEYFMKELRGASSGIVIEIDLSSGDPVIINVQSNLQLGKEAEIRLLPNGESDSELVTFNTLQTSSVSFGKEAYLLGSFNAPNAKVTLVKNTQLRGAICAKEIYVERDCLFLHHESLGSLPGPGDLPKSAFDEDEEVTSTQQPVSSYELSQNYPNPFNPTTTISFALPEASDVTLSIFNTNGQLVKKLVAGAMNAGRHTFTWDATNARGERVASGVYLYVIKAGPSTGSGQAFTAQRKLVLMK